MGFQLFRRGWAGSIPKIKGEKPPLIHPQLGIVAAASQLLAHS